MSANELSAREQAVFDVLLEQSPLRDTRSALRGMAKDIITALHLGGFLAGDAFERGVADERARCAAIVAALECPYREGARRVSWEQGRDAAAAALVGDECEDEIR